MAEKVRAVRMLRMEVQPTCDVVAAMVSFLHLLRLTNDCNDVLYRGLKKAFRTIPIKEIKIMGKD